MLVACSSGARSQHQTVHQLPRIRVWSSVSTVLRLRKPFLMFYYSMCDLKSTWKGHTHTCTTTAFSCIKDSNLNSVNTVQASSCHLLSRKHRVQESNIRTWGTGLLRLLKLMGGGRVGRQKSMWSPQEFVIVTNRVGKKQAVVKGF